MLNSPENTIPMMKSANHTAKLHDMATSDNKIINIMQYSIGRFHVISTK